MSLKIAYPQSFIRSLRTFNRTIYSTKMGARSISDWNAAKYLKFEDERTRPARDLLSRVPLESPSRIVDLGCGPGNSTELLAIRYPTSRIIGVDSSPNMLEKAQQQLPHVDFQLHDVRSYTPKEEVQLLFSNATFQWLSNEERVPTIQRLLQAQPAGGIFALQVPDNYNEPSHAAMRETASEGPWAGTLATQKPERDLFPTPQELYDALKPQCAKVDIWHTIYQHPLESHEAIIDWLKTTGLRPFLEPLDETHRAGFLAAYLERLRKAYPVCTDGRVLLRFPRLFLVLTRES